MRQEELETNWPVGFQLSLVFILCAKMYVNIDLECVRIIHAGDVCIWLKNFCTAAWSSRLCARRDYNAKPCHLRGARPALGSHPHPPCFYIFKTPNGVRCPTVSFYCTGTCTSMPYRCTGRCPNLTYDALHHSIYCTGTCPTLT